MDARGLPTGTWNCSRTQRGRLHGTRHDNFKVMATEVTTGDQVVGHILVGDTNELSRDDLCLAAALELNQLWHLAHIEPRSELASGGTKALVRYLTSLADAEGTWLLTFVQPIYTEHSPIVCALLAKHGGFESRVQEVPFMMTRRPSP